MALAMSSEHYFHDLSLFARVSKIGLDSIVGHFL
jgi:hypothetical protein